MKISMLLTSLVVAMSASHLNAVEDEAKSKQKASDSMNQANSNDAIEHPDTLEEDMTNDIQPDTPKH